MGKTNIPTVPDRSSRSKQQAVEDERNLARRIFFLHDTQGIGFGTISKKENTSKTGAFRLYHKYKQHFTEEIEKTAKADPEYQHLKAISLDLRQEVQNFEAKQKKRREIRDMFIRKAETVEGLAHVLSSPDRLWVFTVGTADEIYAWSMFLAYCKKHKLDPKKKLFEVVGTLTDFEDSIKQGGTDDLANHISLELQIYLDQAEDEKKQAALQKQFRELVVTAKCLDCGQPLAKRLLDGSKRLFLIEGALGCFQCSTIHQMLCLKCKKPLEYKSEENSFFCHVCKLTYPLSA